MTEGSKNFWRVQAVFHNKPVGFTINSRKMTLIYGLNKVDVSNYGSEMACVKRKKADKGEGFGLRPIEHTVVALPSSELCDNGACRASHHCILRLIAKDPKNKWLLEFVD